MGLLTLDTWKQTMKEIIKNYGHEKIILSYNSERGKADLIIKNRDELTYPYRMFLRLTVRDRGVLFITKNENELGIIPRGFSNNSI